MSGNPPLLWLIVGPNGSGKTTYYEQKVRPRLRLEYVNADAIAAERWPAEPNLHGTEAAALADERRRVLLAARRSFVTESVFSHPGRLALVTAARTAGYQIWVTFVCVGSAELSLARVAERVARGGHDIPTEKIRSRYERLFPQCTAAVLAADRSFVVDNSLISAPMRDVLAFERGTLVYAARELPEWASRAFAGVLRTAEEP